MSDLSSPELYINRELSWLEFNDRVLQQGLLKSLPLLERLKFLAIVSSNLDEAFMIRVAGLMQQRKAKRRQLDPSGMTPAEQLDAFSRRAHRMAEEQTAGIHKVLGELAEHGLQVLEPSQWSDEQRMYLQGYFIREVMPVLTPLAVEELHPCPLLPGLRLHVAAVLGVVLPNDGDDDDARKSSSKGKRKKDKQGDASSEKIVVVSVPGQLRRFVELPGNEGVQLVRLEDVIADNLTAVFPQSQILATAMFRITRDGDVAIDDDDAGDLLQTVEEAVLSRRRRAAVRLEISAKADRRIKDWLIKNLEVAEEEIFEIDGMLDATGLFQIAGWPGFADLKIPDWAPQPPADLLGSDGPVAIDPGPRRAALSSLRKFRSRRAFARPGGRRSRRALHQANTLPHQRRLAHHQRAGTGRRKR